MELNLILNWLSEKLFVTLQSKTSIKNKYMREDKLDINIDEDTAEGIYSNCAIIAHSPSEFVIDFIRIMPGVEKAKVKSRIITSPEQAKRLLLSLQDNIRTYETQFGNIDIHLTSSEVTPTPITSKGEA